MYLPSTAKRFFGELIVEQLFYSVQNGIVEPPQRVFRQDIDRRRRFDDTADDAAVGRRGDYGAEFRQRRCVEKLRRSRSRSGGRRGVCGAVYLFGILRLVIAFQTAVVVGVPRPINVYVVLGTGVIAIQFVFRAHAVDVFIALSFGRNASSSGRAPNSRTLLSRPL